MLIVSKAANFFEITKFQIYIQIVSSFYVLTEFGGKLIKGGTIQRRILFEVIR